MYFINLPAINKEDFKDRYDLKKFVPLTENVYDLLDSYFVGRIKNLPQHGITSVQGEEHRPDLISDRIYGTVNLWYILLLYNDWLSMMDIEEGMTVRYPKVDEIEELYFSLNALQKTSTITGVL